MPLRGPPDGRYGGAESPGQPSRERVDPGKADTAPKAAPGFRPGPCCLAATAAYAVSMRAARPSRMVCRPKP